MANTGIVRFGEWISEGFELYKKNWGTWTLMGLVYLGPLIVVFMSMYVGLIFTASKVNNSEMLASIFGGAGILLIALMFFTVYLTAGMYRTAFKALDGQPIEFSDIFSGGPKFLPLLLLWILYILLCFIGALFCIIPAFIVQGMLYLSFPILIREDLGPVEAIQKSFEKSKGDWFMFTLFAFVAGLIAQIGVYACYIGIIFSIGINFTMAVVAYRDCFQPELRPVKTTDSSAPAIRSCGTCGKAVAAGSNFCDNCGASQV